LNGQVQIVAYI